MTKLLVIGIGGFVGAISRHGLSVLAHKKLGFGFPFGTLTVNVLGCFLIGALIPVVEHRLVANIELRRLIITGFLGSLTTFSTFGFETVELVREGDFRLAMVNILANVTLGLIAVWAGREGLRALGV